MPLHATHDQARPLTHPASNTPRPADQGAAAATLYEYSLTREAARTWIESTDTARARQATEADLGYVHDLHDSEFPATYATAAQLIHDPALFTFVVERDGGPIGYASGHIDEDGTGHLDFMAVDPATRGVGDGSVLLAATLRELFARATMDVVRLAVRANRTPAVRFYESRGFTRTATLPAGG